MESLFTANSIASQDAIAGKLEATRQLLQVAEELRSAVQDAEAAAARGRARAREARMALLSGDEEPVLVAEALQRLGLDVKEMVEAPEVPPVRLAENLEGKIWQTAMETRRLVEMAWVAESQQVIEAGSSLASQLVPETDELLQSLITRKVPDAPETEAG